MTTIRELPWTTDAEGAHRAFEGGQCVEYIVEHVAGSRWTARIENRDRWMPESTQHLGEFDGFDAARTACNAHFTRQVLAGR